MLVAAIRQIPPNNEGDLLLCEFLLRDREGIVVHVVADFHVDGRILGYLHRPHPDYSCLLVLRHEGRCYALAVGLLVLVQLVLVNHAHSSVRFLLQLAVLLIHALVLLVLEFPFFFVIRVAFL